MPLIVSAPGLAAGRCAQPVGLVDLYPTLIGLCGLAPEPDLDGHSLEPLLGDPENASWPYAAVTTFGPGNHAVRTERWRYIRYADGSEELYDHGADRHEWHNLLAGNVDGDSRPQAIRATVDMMRSFLPQRDAAIRDGAEASSGYRAFDDAESNRRRR